MEITWYGFSCFKLAGRGSATVVTDPYDRRQTGSEPLKLKADIVTVSNKVLEQYCAEATEGEPYVITGPGEYEVGGVFITGIPTGGQKGAPELKNTVYVFEYESMNVIHLGNLSRTPTQSDLEAIGTINIALVPIVGGSGLNAARAAEVISLLSPGIVIPMNYTAPDKTNTMDPLNKFLKEMGINEFEALPSLKLSSTSLPDETKILVLNEQRG
jgi:L-ascorbate metabolism protein UlaG (beta-lactamase superfamily)